MQIDNQSKIVSEETIEELNKRLNPANEVLKELKLRAGETDVRELSDADFKQAQYRFMNDTLTALNYIVTTLADISVILIESQSEYKKKHIREVLDGDKDKN